MRPEDVIVSDEGIWVSYFDEGVFGEGISTEGLVLFSYKGHPLFQYYTDLKDQPPIVDCYAICKGTESSLWVFPYTDFPLVKVDPVRKTFTSMDVPEELHGANAICVRGDAAYFYDSYSADGKVYQWNMGSNELDVVGKMTGNCRGGGPRGEYDFIGIKDGDVKGYGQSKMKISSPQLPLKLPPNSRF